MTVEESHISGDNRTTDSDLENVQMTEDTGEFKSDIKCNIYEFLSRK